MAEAQPCDRPTLWGLLGGVVRRRDQPPDDPKIAFYETVKEIEARLSDPNVVLDSFIVSNTPSHVMRKQWGIEKPEMVKRHILFQEEDKDSYIGAMLRGVTGAQST